jgi:pyruvate-ferredoxin/flavodoxin oxidoreductase
MKTKKQHIIATGNQAVAHIAYRTNEVCPIYPITPASEMSELVEEWSAEKQQNIFGNVPTTRLFSYNIYRIARLIVNDAQYV